MHHYPSSQIHRTHLQKVSVFRPHRMASRQIHDHSPQAGEPEHGGELNALHESPHHQCRGDDEKGHLKNEKCKIRNAIARILREAGGKGIAQSSDEAIFVIRGKCHGITNSHPHDGHQTNQREAVHQY